MQQFRCDSDQIKSSVLCVEVALYCARALKVEYLFCSSSFPPKVAPPVFPSSRSFDRPLAPLRALRFRFRPPYASSAISLALVWFSALSLVPSRSLTYRRPAGFVVLSDSSSSLAIARLSLSLFRCSDIVRLSLSWSFSEQGSVLCGLHSHCFQAFSGVSPNIG